MLAVNDDSIITVAVILNRCAMVALFVIVFYVERINRIRWSNG